MVAGFIVPRMTRRLTFTEGRFAALKPAGDLVIGLLPLLLPLLAFVFASAGETAITAAFGSAAVMTLGKRIFIFLAVRLFVKHILVDPFLKLLGRVFLIPMALFYVLGINSQVADMLRGVIFPLGNLAFDVLWLVQLVGIGGLIFWFGSWSNARSNGFISEQNEIRPATRQLASKAAEIGIYGFAFLMVMNIMEINLSALAVLGGAIGVGLGFGLQKIASNFISGVILLLEGQATVGDFVELDGGEAGTIVKMTARAAILE
ncbi:MAG: mechanosensitive ion channel family protein, partial [Planktomarina sp.]